MMAKNPHSYVMPGVRWPGAAPRKTVEDPPDYRISQVRPRQLTPEELHAINRPGVVNPRYRAADRWLERWAVTHGSGRMLPLIATLKVRSPTPSVPPLDDHESLLIDGAVRVSPPWASRFAVLWYRSEYSVRQIANELKIKRNRAVYEELNEVLSFYLGCFHGIGLQITFWTEHG